MLRTLSVIAMLVATLIGCFIDPEPEPTCVPSPPLECPQAER